MTQESKLSEIQSIIKKDFEEQRVILSFDEFIELVREDPVKHTRNAPRYLRDVFDYFGKEKVGDRLGKPIYRFKLFDEISDDRGIQLVGQEETQTEFYEILNHFAGEGLSNKMILLHGPNGSSKSTMLSTLMKGLEVYSKTPEGASYTFSWIFPLEKQLSGGMGLGRHEKAHRYGSSGESFAGLSEEMIAAKLHCEFHDHPLLLLPSEYRRKLLTEFFKAKGLVPPSPAENILMSEGTLSPKSRAIFGELLTSYQGDLKKLLRHIQVERLFFSERDNRGAVTVEPQMYVDAQARQLTVDRNLSEFPPVLRSLNLFEVNGALAQANRGIIEYQDLLKRPIDAFRYLLSACEEGRVSVGGLVSFLDVVWLGSTNDLELDEFKEFPDFTSFKARMELIRAPYLLNVSQEQKIYDQRIQRIANGKPVAPHTTWVAALWAVLTRLKKPNPNRYSPELGYVMSNLSPFEKAMVYDRGELPSNLSTEERNHLKANLDQIRVEYSEVPYYEGRIGASPREIISALYDAANNPEHPSLTPLAVLKSLQNLVSKMDQYPFLKQEPQGMYHDHKKFINTVREEYIEILDNEVRTALGLVDSVQYVELIEKYVNHVRHSIKNEKIRNPITGQYQDPDQKFIKEFEKMVAVKDPDHFRQSILSTIASWVLDHKKEQEEKGAAEEFAGVDYGRVFPELVKNLEEFYFSQQKELMKRLGKALMIFGSEEEDDGSDEHKRLLTAIENLGKQFNYDQNSAVEAIGFLLKTKYA